MQRVCINNVTKYIFSIILFTACTPTISLLQTQHPNSKIYRVSGYDYILISQDTVLGVPDALYPSYYMLPNLQPKKQVLQQTKAY